MQDMNELRRMGMVSDEYMENLEDAMKNEVSMENFQEHLGRVEKKPSWEKNVYRGSGGNSKGPLSASQKKRKRKLARKARKLSKA